MKLTKEKIVNEKFESVINGYSPTKVDLFLDLIVKDYEEMELKIQELNNFNKQLQSKIEEQNKEIEILKQKIQKNQG